MKQTIIGMLVLVLGLGACNRAEEESAEVPAAEEMMEEATAEDTGEAEAEAEEATPVAGAPAAAPGREGAEDQPMRNWVLLEFVEPVMEADLEWLEANGFRVDTVMSGNLVRGWLEEPAGGETIARDARIARVSAQAR